MIEYDKRNEYDFDYMNFMEIDCNLFDHNYVDNDDDDDDLYLIERCLIRLRI